MRLSGLFLLPLLAAIPAVLADAGGGIHPAGLTALINQANGLLSSGKYSEATRAYSEAIGMCSARFFWYSDTYHRTSGISPDDYMLYYRRGMAHLSLQRHPQALSDFQTVLQLTKTPPPAAHLQIARLLAKNGDYVGARSSARTYTTLAASQIAERDAQDLLFRVGEAEVAWTKAERARKAGLWTACIEAATLALTTSSHAAEIRGTRAECGIAGGDIELGVSDLT
jgi:DnaJ family protein C protein 3